MSDRPFCRRCGTPLTERVPAGDHKPRWCCDACSFIDYDNPKIIVACIATVGDRVLWIKRGTPPKQGCWAQPSGFMENGETPEQAAARELFEETGAVIDPAKLNLFLVGSLPAISEVYLVYYGELDDFQVATTDEAQEIRLCDESEAPWDRYAYPEVIEATRQFYRDHAKRSYGVYRGRYVDGVNTIERVN
jgi:ADP-ribose pyrophosphatase YjhB (NUDIX family)